MSLVDLLLHRKALSNPSARASIAAQIIKKDMVTSVTLTPAPPKGADTSSLIRFALSAQAKPYAVSPLNVPRFRKALESMALGDNPDLDVLRQIEVIDAAGDEASQRERIEHAKAPGGGAKEKAAVVKPHVAYIAELKKNNPAATSRALQKICKKNITDEDSPFEVLSGDLSLKGSGKITTSGMFQAWFTQAKKLNQES